MASSSAQPERFIKEIAPYCFGYFPLSQKFAKTHLDGKDAQAPIQVCFQNGPKAWCKLINQGGAKNGTGKKGLGIGGQWRSVFSSWGIRDGDFVAYFSVEPDVISFDMAREDDKKPPKKRAPSTPSAVKSLPGNATPSSNPSSGGVAPPKSKSVTKPAAKRAKLGDKSKQVIGHVIVTVEEGDETILAKGAAGSTYGKQQSQVLPREEESRQDQGMSLKGGDQAFEEEQDGGGKVVNIDDDESESDEDCGGREVEEENDGLENGSQGGRGDQPQAEEEAMAVLAAADLGDKIDEEEGTEEDRPGREGVPDSGAVPSTITTQPAKVTATYHAAVPVPTHSSVVQINAVSRINYELTVQHSLVEGTLQVVLPKQARLYVGGEQEPRLLNVQVTQLDNLGQKNGADVGMVPGYGAAKAHR